MKTTLKHKEHDSKIIEEYGFFVFNILESDNPNPSVADLLESDILDKAYFYTKEEIEIRNKQWNKYFEPIPEDNEVIEIYGSVIKEKILPSDFLELNYSEYLKKNRKLYL